MSRYEVWKTSDKGSEKVTDYKFNYLDYATYLMKDKNQWNIGREEKEEANTSAYVYDTHESKVVTTHSFIAKEKPILDQMIQSSQELKKPLTPILNHMIQSSQEPKMTIYTVVITDLNGKYLGCKSVTNVISLLNNKTASMVESNGVTEYQTQSSIGKALYYKEGRVEAVVRFISIKNDIGWVKDLFKAAPPVPETQTSEWTSWTTTLPPHYSIVQARRYGATAMEIDTKYLPANFDRHGMEWKL